MSFVGTVKDRELAYITRLLSVFGVVEERQMRTLFSYLNDKDYGRIMTRIHREGLAYRTADAKYLAASEFTFEKTDIESSVRCFWAFIQIKDKIHDFCASSPPAIITIASKAKDYDLIPLDAKTIEIVNGAMYDINEHVVRFLVTDDLMNITRLDRREKNDFVIHVKHNGDTEIYEL